MCSRFIIFGVKRGDSTVADGEYWGDVLCIPKQVLEVIITASKDLAALNECEVQNANEQYTHKYLIDQWVFMPKRPYFNVPEQVNK